MLDPAREELAEMREKHETEPLGAAAVAARQALESLGQLVAGKEFERPEHLLSQFEAPPLRLGLPLDGSGLPHTTKDGTLEEPRQLWAAIREGRAHSLPSWEDAFEKYAGQRDHRATERIVQIVRASGEEKRANELENERDRHLTRCREAVERDADDAVPRIERAFTYGLFPSEERDQLLSKVDSVRRASSKALKLDALHEDLQDVRDRIANARETKLEAVQHRLEKELDLSEDAPAYLRVEQVIEDGDIHTAHDYIDRLLEGEELPKSTLATAIDGFLPETLERIISFLRERPDWEAVAKKLRSPGDASDEMLESIGPVSLEDVSPEQREGVAELISTWFDVKRREYIDEDRGHTLLSRMGFNPLDVSKEKYANRICLEVEAEVPGPNVVPVPAYGSNVEGRYRALCAWGQPSAEELLNATERLDYGPGLVVFYFAPLSAQERRRIARLCKKRQHEKGHRVLVIDEALMLYLCGQPRDRRLRAFFECTLPFTVTTPYQSTPGYVPPEMFYGRKEEAARIRDPQDTSLVYGGRQLGKTALLRQVEQDIHRPPDQVARWIDLKSHGVGYNRRPAEVWPLLVQELKKEEGMLDEGLAPSTQPETFIDLLEEWLAEESTRRILLLLDEADKFFEMDGQEDFRETARFKRLMERTGRQFKVVFAGLHNVYRTTRDPNQPLAHLQKPVCVGPLLDGEDKVEAARLVERPMAAVGYRFKSSDLVPLILSQTNYYPSLIQDYCRQLLRDLNDRSVSRFDPDSSPPYRVKHEHVRESYKHQELLKEIRKKFHLTLDLDKRYAVIAYAIAWGILEDDPERGDVEGFSVSWVRSQAFKYWSAGFQGNDEEDIDALLDEMVGLGVLRNVSSENGAYSRYTLRSPNVLSLLGNRDAVAAGLLKDRTPEPEYDQATFRRTGGSGYLAPLTAKQTSTIFARESGVTTLFGTQAADLDRVPDFLSGSQPSATVKVMGSKDPDFSAFEKWLDKKSKNRARKGVTLLIVPQTVSWTEEWVRAAQEKINGLKLENSFVRVFFIAGSKAAWQFVSNEEKKPQQLASKETGVITLRPWHPSALHHWLKEWEAVVGDGGRQRISAVTGNWPYLLRRFADQASPTQWKEDLNVFEKECEEEADDILAAFGLGDSHRRRVLSLLAEFDSPAVEEESDKPGLTEEGLLILAEDEDLSEDFVSDTLRWANFLHLIRPEGRRWRVAPPLRRLLSVSP